MKNEMTADEFKVGDKVYCAVFGEGKVDAIGAGYESYPLHVKFPSDTQDYTHDGRLSTYANRTLFFSEPKVEGSVKRPFVYTLVGKRVVINTTEDLCIIGVVNSGTSTTLVIDGRHYFKGGIDAIYEITSDNLLES